MDASTSTDPDGSVSVTIPKCPFCRGRHREKMVHLEQPVTIDSVSYIYWAKCHTTGTVFLLAPNASGKLQLRATHGPVDMRKP